MKYNNDPSYNRFRRLVDSMNVSPHMRSNSKNIRRKLRVSKKMETYVKNIKEPVTAVVDESKSNTTFTQSHIRARSNNPSMYQSQFQTSQMKPGNIKSAAVSASRSPMRKSEGNAYRYTTPKYAAESVWSNDKTEPTTARKMQAVEVREV